MSLSSKRKIKKNIGGLGVIALTGLLFFTIYLLVPKFARSFFYHSYETHIMINGQNYGLLEDQSVIDELSYSVSPTNKSQYNKLTLRREFVAEPSLYWWARKNFENHLEETAMEIHLKNQRGDILETYYLKYCKPLAWTIEEHDSASGGFSETVEIAVRSIHKK